MQVKVLLEAQLHELIIVTKMCPTLTKQTLSIVYQVTAELSLFVQDYYLYQDVLEAGGVGHIKAD